MKKNMMIFSAICLVVLGYYTFDYFSFDGEIELEANIQLPSEIKTYITGEVVRPGVYTLQEGSRIEDLVALAGGFTEEANINTINLAMMIDDGDKVVVPKIIISENERVKDLNSMTIDDFILIDSIGEVTARKIVDYRQSKGFIVLEDLIEVEGIGEQKLEVIKRYLEN